MAVKQRGGVLGCKKSPYKKYEYCYLFYGVAYFTGQSDL